jgi:hypothetical protein
VGKQKGPARSRERERYWRKVVAGQRRSKLSIAAWCGQQGVPACSFYAWRRELAKRDAQRPSPLPLLPVEILASAAGESVVALEIELPSRAKVRVRPGCELELVRQVLTMLRQVEPEAEGC